MAIPAAAGYPQYSGNLINPLFSMELVALFYCATVYSEISTTDYNGDLNRYGDQITFFREPEIVVHSYEKGGNLISTPISSEAVTMTIDRAKYFNVPIDDIDRKQIQTWGALENAILRRGAYNLATQIDTELLAEMFADASPDNAGTTAGVKSHSYNLGVTGNPVPITSANVIQTLSYAEAVLEEQCAIGGQTPFIVFPKVAKPAFLNSDLKNWFITHNDTTILNGRVPNQVMGFNVYFSNFVPQVFDVGANALCYDIPFGVPNATAFALQLQESKVIDNPNSFGQFYRALNVYGFKVLQNKGIGALYARFN